MNTYHLQAHLGETADGHMPCLWADEYADRFRRVGDPLEIKTESVEMALESLYALANIMGPNHAEYGDWVRTYRQRDRARSLSVGDVVVVNGETGYTVDSLGFRPVNDHERDALARSAAYTA